jgi:hypothetical protein
MEIQFKKNVRLICDLSVGDTVKTNNWGFKLDNKDWKIIAVEHDLNFESAFKVKINGYDSWLDSSWLIRQLSEFEKGTWFEGDED